MKGTLESKYTTLRGTNEDLARRDLCVRRVEQTLEQRKQHTIDTLAEENTALQTQLSECDKLIGSLTAAASSTQVSFAEKEVCVS